MAHRIPLYVPPAQITPEEQAQYEQLLQNHAELTIKHDFDAAHEAFQQSDKIGRFLPCFMHHPENGLVPIYPTIPSDVAHLVRVGTILANHIV